MSEPLLKVEGVETYYGNIRALSGVDVEVGKGEIVCLIGANGAGKSTLMMTVCGSPQARSGRVLFEGEDITRQPTHLIARRRIAQSPEGRRIFPRMTVLENLQMGAVMADPDNLHVDLKRMYALFPILEERLEQRAGTLSGGEQQMLAVGRALMSKPTVLMMDEPSLGLAPIFVGMIFDIIREINASGVTVLLVEQNAKAALDVADTGYVMETGTISFSGSGKDLLADDRVRMAYLGEH